MIESEPWYEDDELWNTLGPITMFGEGTWARAAAEVDHIVALLKPNARVLDLGCGPGRHSLEIARRGFRVTALDRTASLIDRARKRAEEENISLEFVQDDMRYFGRPGSFDAVLSLSTSFGFFEDQADDYRVLVNAYSSLKEDGVLIMDLVGKEILARSFTERGWSETSNTIVMVRRTVTKDWTWVEDRWKVLKDGVLREFLMAHRPYSAMELRGLLAKCGFKRIDIHGDLAGAVYDHKASRLVAIARK